MEPTTLALLVEDLTVTITCGSRGSSNYTLLFAQDFVFHPDPNDSLEVSLEKPEAYLGWDSDVEALVFDQIVAAVDSMSLSLSERDRDESGTEAWIEEDYVLTTYLGGNPSEYAGVATFTLRLEGGTWKITEWQDERGTGTSWGRLKGNTRL